MDDAGLAFAGVAPLAELVQRGEVSSRELVEVALRRIERLDGDLNAFCAVYPERALAQAADADRRRRSGDLLPLLGVPVAVKDEIDLADEITSRGTAAGTTPAAEDAEVVRRLRAAGAVIVGKTTMPELGLWPFTESITWGVTRNPWDTDRTPGGSSGGAPAGGVEGGGGGGGRGRLRPRRAGRRRRRFDPHPRGVLRPVRPQAPKWTST